MQEPHREFARRVHALVPHLKFRVLDVDQATIDAETGAHNASNGIAIPRQAGHDVMILSTLPRQSWADALLHEVAHVVADNRNQSRSDRSPHGTEWGRAYAMLYRKFYGTR